MMSEEEAQIQRALKLLQQHEGHLPGWRIRRLLEQQTGLDKYTAEKRMIDAAKRFYDLKKAQAQPYEVGDTP